MLGHFVYFSSTILLMRVPTPCVNETRNSSPSRRRRGGFLENPTPAGVLHDIRTRMSFFLIRDRWTYREERTLSE